MEPRPRGRAERNATLSRRPRPFVGPGRVQPWRTHAVLVVATWNGTFHHRADTGALNKFTTVLYQRADPLRPHYSPNFGFEGGVFLQFMLEHYSNLPNQTIFIQDG